MVRVPASYLYTYKGIFPRICRGHLILADIYAARETDTLGISSADLAEETAKLGTDSHYFPSFGEIETFLKENCRPGDLLLTMGAGDIVTVGEDLVK